MNFQTIIDLNNQALACLYQQDSSMALEASSCALKHQQAIQRSIASSGRTQEISSADQARDCLDQCMLLTQPNCDMDDIQTFVYDLGIVLPATVNAPTVITPILIFNLALAHHQSGLACQDAYISQRMLSKAKRLYQLSHTSVSGQDNVLFHFAVLNNIAVIDRALGNTAESNEYFEYLMSLFMLLVDRGSSELLRQLEGFVANVSSAKCAQAA